ncbi:DNA mismatch repair protein MutS [Feifania hominis]|uniref:DNA mismatch repair protein MutS n=1 Tax=Feifania hominis TaxID=2763660 RepID=A0A926DFC8_9FIRM|nr:DNA mismatch repair protein MutS [Feifania hominis]MBC8536812.1 DNA mismatch repair protein MutS [Feifania hominis]
MAELTPMMQQYMEIKNRNKDYILLYRLGDFYEMFFEDAKLASKELDLVLTGRDCGQEERAPMCGVPYHSCESYIARLVAKGYKVAICEQLEDPATAKGLVKRDIVRVITPGTVTELGMLDESKNNYLAAVSLTAGSAGITFSDISTGEIYATTVEGRDVPMRVLGEIGKFSPTEIILEGGMEGLEGLTAFAHDRLHATVTRAPEGEFTREKCEQIIAETYGADYLAREGLAELPAFIISCGMLLDYFRETQRCDLKNLKPINYYLPEQFMELDVTTRRNLELTETMRQQDKRGSLLGVLDRTKTSMGTRLLRRWIEMPLCNTAAIKKRQNAVAELIRSGERREELIARLKLVSDIERLMTRVVYNTANGRDLRALLATLELLPPVKAALKGAESAYLKELDESLDELAELRELLARAIVEKPPFSVREGGLIEKGYSSEVDSLNDLLKNSKAYILKIENTERERTGIKNLKISYNKVFGYYLEVTKSYQNLVPDHYIRKQTLANCERYITEELKELEGRILSAHERVCSLEYELFSKVREQVAGETFRLQRNAQALAALDVLCSFAVVARRGGYCMPEVDFSDEIRIKDGRHPVVEDLLKDALFVPNDTLLDTRENRLAIITGPNMAGKSTYMRQVAVITLMAQIGSFVPASSAHIGVVDKIFTRVGAADDLAMGQSTFMVEMSEVAHILKNATKKSLIIYDEIGRGTSTFDGMSIARAVVEFTADRKLLGAKTLFATHYHELTELERTIGGVKNYNIAVKKRGDDITFLRKIVRGGADDSYGIEVAKLAGIPQKVITRAKEILQDIELAEPVRPAHAPRRASQPEPEIEQTSFERSGAEALAESMRMLDVNTLTPIEAMNKLFELCNEAKKL